MKDFRPRRRTSPTRRSTTAPAATRSSRWRACAQAWKAAGLDAAKLDLDRVGIYLGSGEGSLDFDAYTDRGPDRVEAGGQRRSTP